MPSLRSKSRAIDGGGVGAPEQRATIAVDGAVNGNRPCRRKIRQISLIDIDIAGDRHVIGDRCLIPQPQPRVSKHINVARDGHVTELDVGLVAGHDFARHRAVAPILAKRRVVGHLYSHPRRSGVGDAIFPAHADKRMTVDSDRGADIARQIGHDGITFQSCTPGIGN